ncbi:MAG: hypothetical protein IJQ95_02700 [Paludibacteraceae bacterium]|nr:hypothetical protein [Paludibacteraceae bacterium]
MKTRRIITVLLTALFALTANAVTKYSCDFETAADRAHWTLNKAATEQIYSQLTNKWYIGTPGNNDPAGNYGLYISDDNGVSAHYSSNACWVVAYDTVTLDKLSTADDYVLSFDYCGMGNVASLMDGIYLMWIPVEDNIPANSIATFAGVPSTHENYIISLQPKANMDYLGGTQTWKTYVGSIANSECDGKPHLLVFVWANTSAMTQQPGGMIDNIAILDTRPCDEPVGLSLDIHDNITTFSWVGTASEYEVLAYSYEEETWYGPSIVSGTSTDFAGLPMGQTDFIVRAKCNDDLYSIKTSISKLVYYPDQMCVDYLNLDKAKCYTGTGFSSSDNFNNYVLGAPVDLGPANSLSRHTIHFDKTERDLHTEGLLPTIPEGELASVRLGNWENGNQTERIEFSFNVDTIDYPVLMLKYAPVFEADKSHTDDIQTRFKLDVLIGNKSIGECGRADFNVNSAYTKSGTLKPGAAEQGWHLTPAAKSNLRSYDIVWKEWTTVGVNLRDPQYQNKKLTVRLTTFDCAQTAHAGYAYFTLSCSDGQLKGMKCDTINPVFEAPDGFVYRWAYAYNEKFRKDDGSLDEQYILGRSQKYEAGYHDDSLYVVDCMFVQDTTCYFSLYASTLATNPVSVGKQALYDMNCETNTYRVRFDASKSYVEEIDHVTGDTLVSTRHKLQYIEWDFGDGTKSYDPIAIHPFKADETKDSTYTVTLRTRYLTCEDEQTITFTLAPIEHYSDSTIAYLCDADKDSGKGYTWRGKHYTDYKDLDSIVVPSSSSCDTVHYFSLREPHRDTVTTMIFDYETYNFHGTEYNKQGVYHYISESCDTAAVLNLSIYETLAAKLLTENYIACQGDASVALEVEIIKGKTKLYSNVFEDTTKIPSIHRDNIPYVGLTPAIVIPVPTDLYPNIYKGVLTLHDTLPEQDVNLPYTIEMRYPATVLTQRWNDVLALKNAEYNDIYNPGAGYDFTAFQWYKDGKPIDGATQSYLFVDGGLDFSANYSAEVTRKDGQKLMTCDFTPTKVQKVSNIPSLMPLGSTIKVPGMGKARWFSPLGLSVSEQDYNDSYIATPQAAGTFLLQLAPQDGKTAAHTYRVVIY